MSRILTALRGLIPAGHGVARTDDRRLVAVGLVLAVILFVAINLTATQLLRSVRVDLTENRLYTLSPATEEVLAAIDEPIRLRFYFSQRLSETIPQVGTYARRVRDLLETYAARADGGIVLEYFDPEPFSLEEDRAVAAGLIGFPLGDGSAAYFGLVGVNSVDEQETIAFFRPEAEAELEYDLTRMVAALADPEPVRVAVLSRLPIAGGPAPEGSGLRPGTMMQPFMLHTRMMELFDVSVLPDETAVIDPDDYDVLLFVHPRDFPESTLYAVDQFLMNGGRAMVFVDPNSESEAIRRPPQAGFSPTFSTLGPFEEAWGVMLLPDQVATDAGAAIAVNVGTQRNPRRVPYPAWMALTGGRLADGRITGSLEQVNMASAGILRAREDRATTLTPLIVTGPESMPVPVGQVAMNPDPVALMANFEPVGRPLWLAARVEGNARSIFPDGPPDRSLNAEHRAATTRPLDLIVVADTDLLDDRYWVQIEEFGGERTAVPFADNDDFVGNAIEALAGARDLSGLRGRTTLFRPFTRLTALQDAADEEFRATEQALQEELQAAQAEMERLAMDGGGEGNQAILSLTQRQTLQDLRTRMLEVRRELREVQRALRADVAAVQTWATVLNIALMPALVALAAIGVAIVGQTRRRAIARRRRAE